MNPGFQYLVAILDWFSRYVLAWALSNTLEVDFCLDALGRALMIGTPHILNKDQESQFTRDTWLAALHAQQIRISMDARGRALDNVFVERLWRTVKYEDIYLRDYIEGRELHQGLSAYLHFYNTERMHGARRTERRWRCTRHEHTLHMLDVEFFRAREGNGSTSDPVKGV